MIDELFFIEKAAYRGSLIHDLDARVKLVAVFAIIIATVALPYSTAVFTVGGMFLFFLAFLWSLSTLSPLIFAKRLGTIMPFGLCIIVFQIFLTNPYYTTFHVVARLPLGIQVYAESIEFASILFLKFVVCISAIVLLSSTTKLQDMLKGAERLGLPAEFLLALSMTIRYLFVFGYIYRKINETFKTRCFDPFDRKLSYRYRLRQIGYTVGSLFLRSYEQGERTYLAMLCRGYGRESHRYHKKIPLLRRDWAFLLFCLAFVVVVPVVIYLG